MINKDNYVLFVPPFDGYFLIWGKNYGFERGNRLTLFLSSDLQYVDGKWVKYFSINGKVIGALVQDEQSSVFYPIVTDVRNSLRMIFSKNQPVVIKNYNDWGNLNTEKSRLSKLSEIIKLDFSSLFRNSNNSKFLISQSRIYSPTHHQWTTYDSLMLRNPEKITFSNIRETDGISYAAGDPINYANPSGRVATLVTMGVVAVVGGFGGGIYAAATGANIERGMAGGIVSGLIIGSGVGLISAFTGPVAATAAIVGPVGMVYGQMFRSTGRLFSDIVHEVAAGVSYMSFELLSSFSLDRVRNSSNTGSSKDSGSFSSNRYNMMSNSGSRSNHGSVGNSGGGQSEYTFSTSYGTGGAH